MSFWDDVKEDLQKTWKEGLAAVRVGATAVKVKAEELTEEGKRRYRIYELKTQVEREVSDLGGRVYDMSSSKKNPLLDTKVKAVIGRIRKLEDRLAKLEGRSPQKQVRAGKTARPRRARGTTGAGRQS